MTPLLRMPETPGLQQGKLLLSRGASASASSSEVSRAEETREAFTQFVGTTVFGQMLSSMRKTVGEPAYFHGGQAEKVFQGQLDQAIADELTASGGSQFAQSLFEQQFPDMAEVLRRAEAPSATPKAPALDQLTTLPRR